MKRNNLIDLCRHKQLAEHSQCVAFHEAGHAVAIHLNNQARKLPPVYFHILFNGAEAAGYHASNCQACHDDSVAKVEGGRLIHTLPFTIDGQAQKLIDQNGAVDYLNAFEADIINLLVGPLAEAKYVHARDDELFNNQLVNLNALGHYGGNSDLALVYDYLESYSGDKQQQADKLAGLFDKAFDFVRDYANWKAITTLANYLLESNKSKVSCEEAIAVLGR